MKPTTSVLARAVSGVEASQLFDAHRKALLEDLANNANDKSLAGRVDPQIAPLVAFINDRFDDYVTTSSCSGRIALFHRGQIEDTIAAELLPSAASERDAPRSIEGSAGTSSERKRGGLGRGTLFQSHDPLPSVDSTVRDEVFPALARFWRWRQRLPLTTPLTKRTELLQLKFEPMILHIMCRDIEAASALLQCASEAAQGNSGILSCSRGTRDHRKITCNVTSPVAMDVPLFSEGRWLLPMPDNVAGDEATGKLEDSPAWEALLSYAIGHANGLFAENAKRTERFRCVLEQRLLAGPKKSAANKPVYSQIT